MAGDQKLSQLPTGSAITDADLFYSDQSASSVAQPASAFASYFKSKTAPTYYISAAGSDANNGLSPATAWQTLSHVNGTVATPGSTFLFRGGDTFSGTITAPAGGLSGQPITYDSWGDGRAIINSGNAGGYVATDLGNLTVQNLIFVGSGESTNTNYGVSFLGPTLNCSNITIRNLDVSGYGLTPIYFLVGGVNQNYYSNILISGCVCHDCGQNGIWQNQGNTQTNTVPPFLSYYNVTVQNCTVYNITGHNASPLSGHFEAFGIFANGTDGYTVQNCTVHDCGPGGAPGSNGIGPAISCSTCNNVLFQFNEVYNQLQGTTGHDAGGLLCDFGTSNAIVQYNYVHDIMSYCFATGSTFSAGAAINVNNITFRYNVCLNNGTVLPGIALPGGINVYTFGNATERVLGLKFYNNVVSANTPGIGVFSDAFGAGGGSIIQGIVANNIFVGDGSTPLLQYGEDSIRFVGNQYVGGGTNNTNNPKVLYKGSPYATIANWISATAATIPQEAVDGGSVLITAPDPLFIGPYPLKSLTAGLTGGTIPGRAANAQISPMSPVAGAGLDLSVVTPIQTNVPLVNNSSPTSPAYTGFDWDFKGGKYNGENPPVSWSSGRTATTATDLLYTDPMGRAFTTFGANTLRITPGRGLLVEGARTQFLLNPGAPVTQTTASIANGTNLILWVNGPGNAIATGGSGTLSVVTPSAVAVHGRPAQYTMTGTGTVVVTVTGSLNQFQLENDPAGNGGPTSFISAIGTRDADAITNTSATLISIMSCGSTSVNSLHIFFKLPPLASSGTLISESTNTSTVGLEYSGFQLNAAYDVFVNFGASTLTRTTKFLKAGIRQAIAFITSRTAGQILVANGQPAVINASVNSPTATTINIGNNQAGTLPLNGYIERMFVNGGGNPMVTADLIYNTTLTPIQQDVIHDFWGNPVPGNNGAIAIGAHQPVAPSHGATVTLNGTTPVTVTDSSVSANSTILFTLKTVGGTVGAVPSIKTITPGTGFTVAGTAADTSVYNYLIMG